MSHVVSHTRGTQMHPQALRAPCPIWGGARGPTSRNSPFSLFSHSFKSCGPEDSESLHQVIPSLVYFTHPPTSYFIFIWLGGTAPAGFLKQITGRNPDTGQFYLLILCHLLSPVSRSRPDLPIGAEPDPRSGGVSLCATPHRRLRWGWWMVSTQ